MRLPSLKSLHTFQVAGKHQSFKDAADELHITASAVSHQIRNLERQLGVRLFRRLTRSLEFTDAGRDYFEFLDTMFSRLESETAQLRSQFGRNIVRLCVPPFFASEVLLPRLLSFQQSVVSTDLRVTTQPSAMQEHPADADISILLGKTHWPELATTRLFPREVIVAASKYYLDTHSITDYSDLDGKTLIIHENRAEAWKDWATRLGIPPPTPGRLLRSDSMSAVARAAQQGLGVALISWPLGKDLLDSGLLCRVFDEAVPTDEHFYVAHRTDDAEREEVRSLLDWLVSEFVGFE